MLNPLITSQTKQREREKERETQGVRERQRTERIRTQALSYSSRVTSKARIAMVTVQGWGKDVLTWESVGMGWGWQTYRHRDRKGWGLK